MAQPKHPRDDWDGYYRATLESPLHPIHATAAAWLPGGRELLDLGCGVGTATAHYARLGYRIRAVDAMPQAIDLTGKRLPDGSEVTLEVADFDTLPLPEAAYDVVVAGFSLFFLDRPTLDRFWPRVRASLKPGGLFIGQLLGPRDDWVDRGYAVHRGDELGDWFTGFELLHHEEVERDGTTADQGAKHWHVHHLVARKR